MVTLKEIAKTVGVSSATVSRVLNFDTTLSITEKKRVAIIETAEALNYETPRARNRANQQGLNKIALVHFLRPEQELIDPYYVSLRLGIESRCQAMKIEVVKVYHTENFPAPTLLQSASGVIVIGRHAESEINWIKNNCNNLVFADFAPPGDEFDSVRCDLALATQKLLHGLTQTNYRRIGFIGWHDVIDGADSEVPEIRMRTYQQWMTAHSLFDPAICKTDLNTAQSGYRLTREMLASGDRPDAIITCNDNMAVGAYRALHEVGLKIPGDIAIASFNDISAAQFLNPPLSTVRLPSEEIGETAVELLLERVAGRTLAKHITLASELKWRGSTRPVTPPDSQAG